LATSANSSSKTTSHTEGRNLGLCLGGLLLLFVEYGDHDCGCTTCVLDL
jgi:hypothetical protein